MNNLLLSCSFPGPRSIVTGSEAYVTTCMYFTSFSLLVTVVVGYLLPLPFFADMILLSMDNSFTSTNSF
jgi:hypothetical protein